MSSVRLLIQGFLKWWYPSESPWARLATSSPTAQRSDALSLLCILLLSFCSYPSRGVLLANILPAPWCCNFPCSSQICLQSLSTDFSPRSCGLQAPQLCLLSSDLGLSLHGGIRCFSVIMSSLVWLLSASSVLPAFLCLLLLWHFTFRWSALFIALIMISKVDILVFISLVTSKTHIFNICNSLKNI